MTDHDLSSMMRDAVSDVHPGDGLDAIRSRTSAARPSPSRWLPLTVAAAVAVVLVIGGTVWVADLTSSHTPVAGHDDRAPTRTGDTPGRDLNVPVAYVGSTKAGPRLFTEYHSVRDTRVTPLQAAVNEAFSAQPEDPDYTNVLRDLHVAPRATLSGAAITIDLSEPLQGRHGLDAATAEMVVQSIVWTADTAASAGRAPVTFTVEGRPTSDVLGVDTRGPVSPGNPDSTLATVSIESPSQGAHVSTTFDVRGQAATFEANVVWELEQDGHVVKKGFTTAAECCTLSPYSFTVTAPPGEYTLRVHDTDESDGEGVGTSEDTKTIVLE